MPHDFIFNREWYDRFGGHAQLEEFRSEFDRLKPYEQKELLGLLSSCDPKDFVTLSVKATTARLRRILHFYLPVSKEDLSLIWQNSKALTRESATNEGPAEDERVEDAGLDQEAESPLELMTRPKTRRTQVAA
jgi:hypothetical protein